jgi:2-oxoglutarate dehydrogenase E2 component (dihydrolipoamide succinyltransferase)
MAVEVRVPVLGESLVEATVGRWLKKEGDRVAAGDPLVELETEKVSLEVPADQDGVLERITHREGDTVNVGDVLATLAPAAETPAAEVRAPRESRSTGPAAPSPEPEAARGPAPPPERSEGRVPQPQERTPAAPSARRQAAEAGIDLARVPGTGPGGRITTTDVREFRERPTAPAGPATAPAAPPLPTPAARDAAARSIAAEPNGRQADREERIRLSRRRLTIARRLVEAQQTAAILTTFNEVDMSAVMEVRRRRRDAFKERYGVGLGFMSFFTRAVVGALKAFPILNAEVQGEEIVLKRYYDIGIAVATDEGLVVPVLRDADRKSFAEIEREIEQMARRARENALTPQELIGGTFTITNGGVFGSLLSTPILNPPQVGIIGMHKIEERPVAIQGQVAIHPMMYVALSYDHRIVDGREAVQFLVRVKELIEDPETLLLEG